MSSANCHSSCGGIVRAHRRVRLPVRRAVRDPVSDVAVLMAHRAKASADFAPMLHRARREIVSLVAAAEDQTVRRVAIGQYVEMANVGSVAIATAVGQDRVPMIPRNGRAATQIKPFKRN